ncbi:MAG: hypothetical protein ABI594_06220 [Ginsengibacter sp.]
MNQLLMPARNELSETVYDFPSVSITMAFEPKMISKKALCETVADS